MTGDGLLDLIAPAPAADVVVVDEGSVLVWAGGPSLAGAPAPFATLTVPGARKGDLLGDLGAGLGLLLGNAGPGLGVLLGDTDADGALDVVAGAADANRQGVHDSGAIYVWNGAALRAGTTPLVAPTAELVPPFRTKDDPLGPTRTHVQGLQLFDLDARPGLEVIGVGHEIDVGGLQDAGAGCAWSAPLQGSVDPVRRLLIPGGSPNDNLGR